MLVLIGPPGAGKSTVGRALADLLRRDFVDTDAVLVERYGPIAGIFAQYGESGFREREAEVVAQQLRGDREAVVSLGGGAILDATTRELLREHTVILLDTSFDTVRTRVAFDGSRPLLSGSVNRWQELYDSRLPLYHSVARHVIDARVGDPSALAEAIIALVDENQPRSN